MQEELFNIIQTELTGQLKSGAEILLIIVSVSYISSIFTATIRDDASGLKEVVAFAVICLLGVPIIENVYQTVTSATDTIEEIRTVMLSSVPALCATQASSVGAGTAIFLTLTQSAAVLMTEIFLPLALAYSIVGICNGVSNNFSLEGVRGMVKSIFNWGLGLTMIFFSCTATLSGALTGARTSMAARTMKYTGAMVPVVGRYLAESTDMVFAGASVIRGTAGMAALSAILFAAAAPCVKMACNVIVYRLAAMLIKPVADYKISNVITNVGDAFMMITGITALMSVLSVLNISVLVAFMGGGV